MPNTNFITEDPRTVHGEKKNKLIKFASASFKSFKKGIDKKRAEHLTLKEEKLEKEYVDAYKTVQKITNDISDGKEKKRTPLNVAVDDLSKIAVKLVDINLKRRLIEEKKSKKAKLPSSTLKRISTVFKNRIVDYSTRIVEKADLHEKFQDSAKSLYSAARTNNSAMNSELDRLKDYNNYSAIFDKTKNKEENTVIVQPTLNNSSLFSVKTADNTKADENKNASSVDTLVNSSDMVSSGPSIDADASNSNNFTDVKSDTKNQVSGSIFSGLAGRYGAGDEKTQKSSTEAKDDKENSETAVVKDEGSALETGKVDGQNAFDSMLEELKKNTENYKKTAPEVKKDYESRDNFYNVLNGSKEGAKSDIVQNETNENVVNEAKTELPEVTNDDILQGVENMSLEQLNDLRTRLDSIAMKKQQEQAHIKVQMFHQKDDDDYLRWYDQRSASAYNQERQEDYQRQQAIRAEEEKTRFEERKQLRQVRDEYLAQQANIEARLAEISGKLDAAYETTDSPKKM